MSAVAIVAAGIAAAAAVGSAAYSADRNRKAQHQAADAQREASDKQLKQQQQEFNKANQQSVNLEDVYANEQNTGVGTMITGPSGVSKNQLNLGGGSLLGG